MPFFADLAVFDDFSRVVDPQVFQPADQDSWLGMSDVVDSTAAIAEGRYKSVNMAGAAVISALMNSLRHRDFPFVFGGDGASFVVPATETAAASAALTATAAWVKEELGLKLRIGLVPIAAIRAVGLDLTIARYAASNEAAYAVISGGGLAWAETQIKAGHFALAPAPGSRPDLTGLSCRWQPMQASNGTILSLIVQQAPGATQPAFAAIVRDVLAELERKDRQGHPVPVMGPSFRWPPGGLALEARASAGRLGRWPRQARLWAETLLALALFRTGQRLGGFYPGKYRRQIALNSDYRKFDDGLRMTVDCDIPTADRIETLLEAAKQAALVRYGTHRQTAALMTCIVPSIEANDHLHFIDGAGGGYAMAARALKAA